MITQGRPRNMETTSRIVKAVSELVVEHGFSGVTVGQVVERAGTNKPAFYRRFRGLADVVPHALFALEHDVSGIDTGSIEGDLLEFQRRQRQLFSAPLVSKGLVGWLAEVSETPESAKPFIEQFQAPRREVLRRIVARASARGEIASSCDVDWITDVLTAPLIMRAIIPGLPSSDDRLIEYSVRTALDVLRKDRRLTEVGATASEGTQS